MIYNLTQHTLLAQSHDIANTPLSRMKGLLGKQEMPAQHALVITHCNSIHMMFMRFPIDVVFINKKNCVVGLVRQIPPFAFSPIFWDSSCAIELPAGTIQTSKTTIGDCIEIK